MYKHQFKTITDFETLCAELHLCTSKAYDAFKDRFEQGPKGVDEFQFARALNYLIDFCAHHKIDIAGAVAKKQAHNETRPMRHGNKKI
jgi:hypothetical protein